MSTQNIIGQLVPDQLQKVNLINSKDQVYDTFEFDGVNLGRIELGNADNTGLQRLSKGIVLVTMVNYNKNDELKLSSTKKVNLHEFLRNDMTQSFLDIDRVIDKPSMSEYATRNTEYWTIEFGTDGLELLEGETLSLTVMAVAK